MTFCNCDICLGKDTMIGVSEIVNLVQIVDTLLAKLLNKV